MADPNQSENEIARVLSPPATLMQSAGALFAIEPDLELPVVRPGPRKETARIGMMPRPAASKAEPASDAIPRVLCWALLGGAIAILLIEIWNYVS
jgi:hypothetical protein